MRAKSKRAGARAGLTVLALLLWLAPSALAGPPIHPPAPALDLIGAAPDPGVTHPAQPFNHACGTAVDSKGDVYIASAGNGVIDVFNAAHEYLTSIANANEPCGLAVDSTGRLYVSEQALGNVVRYTPNAYPFSGTPTYGSSTTIDASGNARGIAVDPTDDSLYVAEGTRLAVYKSDGTLFTGNEVQIRKFVGSPTGGTYTLSFEGSKTEPPLAYNAPASGPGSIQEALEALPTIGVGNVTVSGGFSEPKITFVGALVATNVPQIEIDPSDLVGGSAEIKTNLEGFVGHLGEGELTDATGVASHTFVRSANAWTRRYISVADAATDKIEVFLGRYEFPVGGFLPGTLEPRQTIDGSETPAGELGLASTGAYVGLDPKNGHLYAYDAAHHVLNEFEATGHYFTQISNAAFIDAQPTAVAVDRSGGTHDGDLYVTAGPGAGATLLAFGPVDAPSRPSLGAPRSRQFTKACGTVVDSAGNLYVAGESIIRIYDPAGVELTSIGDPAKPCHLAVDSEGNLYAAELGASTGGDEMVDFYEPGAFPPVSGTTYTKNPTPIEPLGGPAARGIAVNPANDHLFVTHPGDVIEYDSAAHGSSLLDPQFCGLNGVEMGGVDVYGANGHVYVFNGNEIAVCNASGSRVLTHIDGSGSPAGLFGSLSDVSIAVDQSNGHVLAGEMSTRSIVEEYEASGAFVAKYGSFTKLIQRSDIAVDSSGGPTRGNLYVAYDDSAPGTFDLTGFGALAYGEPPVAVAGTASGFGAGTATLSGTVDPRGFELTECKFEYVSESAFEASGFSDLSSGGSKPCIPGLVEIGKGTGAVAVHATTDALADPEGRYRIRLLAENKYGSSEDEGLFGPPVITIKSAQPILYREATLRASLDPSGLETKYRFEYGVSEAYGQSTPTKTLQAGAGETDIEAFLTDLAEGTTYHFRVVAENEDATVEGIDQTFETLEKLKSPQCSNETLRLENNSSNLPDCRAYELVTPADTRGATPEAALGSDFNNWLVTPSGPLAGESLTFFIVATLLPGTEGSGRLDAFHATRGSKGWGSQLFSPSYVQKGEKVPVQQGGVSSDQLYSFWSFGAATPPGAFPPGTYLRTPAGFEPLGVGSLGTDSAAQGRYIGPGGSHVIFATESSSAQTAVQLEPDAPPSPLGAVYDRSPGGPTHVVSLLPGEITPTSSATYQGASPDGSAVVFGVAGKLYLRLDNTETIEVADAPARFAGLSEDGKRVFYESGGDIYACDVEVGPCVGGIEPPGRTRIAASAKFVVISADGSHAYFISEESGKQDLEMWDGGASHLVAALDPKDLFQNGQVRFPGTTTLEQVALDSWAADCVLPNTLLGRAACPSRASPDGRFLVFQSHADLTPPYEGEGHSEIYRYDAENDSLLCVSCDPSGASATADADLQPFAFSAPTQASTLIPGITDDGRRVFFQTTTALLPEDANSVLDVYEWLAEGAGGCKRPTGCLALISSGQGDNPSYIYSMTLDGHDVFFKTLEKLVASDIAGSPSIYDARVDGGFPVEAEAEPCHGDACQGEGTPAPSRPTVRSDVPNSGNGEQRKARCPKGRRAVKRNGRTRCVRPHHKKHRRAKAMRRAAR